MLLHSPLRRISRERPFVKLLASSLSNPPICIRRQQLVDTDKERNKVYSFCYSANHTFHRSSCRLADSEWTTVTGCGMRWNATWWPCRYRGQHCDSGEETEILDYTVRVWAFEGSEDDFFQWNKCQTYATISTEKNIYTLRVSILELYRFESWRIKYAQSSQSAFQTHWDVQIKYRTYGALKSYL